MFSNVLGPRGIIDEMNNTFYAFVIQGQMIPYLTNKLLFRSRRFLLHQRTTPAIALALVKD